MTSETVDTVASLASLNRILILSKNHSVSMFNSSRTDYVYQVVTDQPFLESCNEGSHDVSKLFYLEKISNHDLVQRLRLTSKMVCLDDLEKLFQKFGFNERQVSNIFGYIVDYKFCIVSLKDKRFFRVPYLVYQKVKYL